MSRTHHHGKYKITGDRRPKPDARRLAKALTAWLEAQREREAMAQDQVRRQEANGKAAPKRSRS